jgi:hypothetical protein
VFSGRQSRGGGWQRAISQASPILAGRPFTPHPKSVIMLARRVEIMFFYFVGAALIVGTALLVVLRREVSLGHAAIVSVGALIIAIPQLADVEVGTDGLKFATRAQGETLTNKLEGTNEQIRSIQEGLEKLTKALEENTKRIVALETKDGVTPNTGTGLWEPGTYDKGFFDDLMKRNDHEKTLTLQRLDELDHLKKSFQPKVWNAPVN